VPKEPKCLVCIDPATRVAVNELRSQKCSIRDIASRVNRSRASVARHLKHAEIPGRDSSAPSGRKSAQARRSVAGRCLVCGLSSSATDSESLLRRAERLLWLAETIAAQAQRDDDARLALQAVDRARAAMDTMMRATGLSGGDQVNINVDARTIAATKVAAFSEAELRLLAEGKPIPALTGGKIGTPLRDAEGVHSS
jgi:hypothetical protein